MKKITDPYFRESWNKRVYELENEELNNFTSETMNLYGKKGQGELYYQSLTKNGVRIDNLNKRNRK